MKKDRREFLKGATIATGAAASVGAAAQAREAGDDVKNNAPASPPTHAQRVDETGEDAYGATGYSNEEEKQYFVDNPVSDFMVDALKSLNIEYISINAGSSFRGLQESLVNYGGNKNPEILTCLHEESAAAIAHGYAKAKGKPMAMLCHSTVGIQHAAMAIYNAYCDRVPMIILGGNYTDAENRTSFVQWVHAAQNAAAPVKDFIKYYDAPQTEKQFAESLVRAYKIATTAPAGPVFISIDKYLQEKPMKGKKPAIPRLSLTTPPQGDIAALKKAADKLVKAENPVIVADRYAHTPAGMDRLIALAEVLQAPVIDRFGRMNFPNRHHLAQFGNAKALLPKADVILGLEVQDLHSLIFKTQDTPEKKTRRVAREDVSLISIGVDDLSTRSNYQNFQRYTPVDLSIAGDAEATLPSLIEQVKSKQTSSQRRRMTSRKESFQSMHAEMNALATEQAAVGWDASPVSVSRLCMEIWDQIKEEDWSMLGASPFLSHWAQRLWDFDQHHRHTGVSGGWGIGYFAPAAVGVALANRDKGRMTVSIQSDGDLMYAPGILWTAAHHNIPLLYVMHNNRAYHQEIIHLQRMCVRRQRGVDGAAKIGNVIDNPNIDFAQLAQSMGIWSAGPIDKPGDLQGALKRAVAVVKGGKPALVDVVCQPR